MEHDIDFTVGRAPNIRRGGKPAKDQEKQSQAAKDKRKQNKPSKNDAPTISSNWSSVEAITVEQFAQVTLWSHILSLLRLTCLPFILFYDSQNSFTSVGWQ